MAAAPPSFSLPPALDLIYRQQGSAASRQHHVQPAKKGAPWSDEEHKAFLHGLKIYGRGQWKQISRYYVPSRTPTQVASHAQKHFLRQSGAQKRRSRFSAVEEAAMAAAAAAPVPTALAALQHAAPLPPPSVSMPGVFGHVAGAAAGAPLPPAAVAAAQHTFSMLQHARLPVAAPLMQATGAVKVVMGLPIGVLPPLPSITTASGTELPILPVLPGRIHAMAAAAGPPAPAPASSYSADSSGGEPMPASGPPSPAPPGARLLATPPPPLPYSGPSGRSRKLLQLLELNEQLAADRTSSGSAAAAAQPQPCASSAPGWPPVRRVPSATAALDALASLAEAESHSDMETCADGADPAATPPPQQAGQFPGAAEAQAAAATPLVSAC